MWYNKIYAEVFLCFLCEMLSFRWKPIFEKHFSFKDENITWRFDVISSLGRLKDSERLCCASLHSHSCATSFPHSAVLSLPVVLLRKVSIVEFEEIKITDIIDTEKVCMKYTLFQKWRPINYSFVCMLIYWPPFWNKVYTRISIESGTLCARNSLCEQCPPIISWYAFL